MLKMVISLLCIYGCVCIALDGLGTAWWHWPLVVVTVIWTIGHLVREELRQWRLRRSVAANLSRFLDTISKPSRALRADNRRAVLESWRRRDPWTND